MRSQLFILYITFLTTLTFAWNTEQVSDLLGRLTEDDPTFASLESLVLISDGKFSLREGDVARMAIMSMDLPITSNSKTLSGLVSTAKANRLLFIFLLENESSLDNVLELLQPAVLSPNNYYLFLTDFVPDMESISYADSRSMYKYFTFGYDTKNTSQSMTFVAPKRLGQNGFVTTNIWSPQKNTFLVGKQSIFLDLMLDFEGREIKITTFNYPPKVYGYSFGYDGFQPQGGYEISFMLALAESLNFEATFRTPPDRAMWGGYFNETHMNGMKGLLIVKNIFTVICDSHI